MVKVPIQHVRSLDSIPGWTIFFPHPFSGLTCIGVTEIFIILISLWCFVAGGCSASVSCEYFTDIGMFGTSSPYFVLLSSFPERYC